MQNSTDESILSFTKRHSMKNFRRLAKWDYSGTERRFIAKKIRAQQMSVRPVKAGGDTDTDSGGDRE